MSFFRMVIWYMRGRREFTRSGYEAAAASFNPKDLDVDISGRSFLITGANSGIGFAMAEALAKKGAAAIHIVCRNKERGEEARKALVDASHNQNVILHVADMADAAAVRGLADSFLQTNTPLHVVINNAGCMLHKKQLSPQGLEMNFACNTFGTYLLTSLLIPHLAKQQDSRVITVSSGGMYLEGLDADDIQLTKRPFKGDVCYEQQKRQQVVMMEMFARSHPNISFYTMHPGWADTPAFRDALPDFYNKMKDNVRTPEQGADTAVWLAVSKSVPAQDNGGFFQDRKAVGKHLWLVRTDRPMADQERFMTELDKLAKSIFPADATAAGGAAAASAPHL